MEVHASQRIRSDKLHPYDARNREVTGGVAHQFVSVMLCLLAGIKALPQEIYEAARIDGASPWKSFIHITLPLIQPTIKVVLLFRTMDAFRIFDLVFMLTRGGPGTITETVSMHNYEVLANYFRVGYASAMSVMILAMALTICLTYILILRTKWEA